MFRHVPNLLTGGRLVLAAVFFGLLGFYQYEGSHAGLLNIAFGIYVVALVTLEEGVRMSTNIVGCAPEDVTAYMPVMVQFRDVTPEITLPVFAPA